MTEQSSDPKSDPEEYKRFLDMAKQVEASEDPKAFDKAFGKVAKAKAKSPPPNRP